MPTRTRVYGYIVTALWTAVGLGPVVAALAQADLDCDQPTEARAVIGRLRLAEIEGAEDIHRARMWDAFGRCPAGAAGEPCRQAERRRFDARWDEEKGRIEAKYRSILQDFEQRCRSLRVAS